MAERTLHLKQRMLVNSEDRSRHASARWWVMDVMVMTTPRLEMDEKQADVCVCKKHTSVID